MKYYSYSNTPAGKKLQEIFESDSKLYKTHRRKIGEFSNFYVVLSDCLFFFSTDFMGVVVREMYNSI